MNLGMQALPTSSNESSEQEAVKVQLSKYFTSDEDEIANVNEIRKRVRENQFDKQAQYMYGRALAHGKGCLVDYKKAYIHLARAILFNEVPNQFAYMEMSFILHKKWCKSNNDADFMRSITFLAVASGVIGPYDVEMKFLLDDPKIVKYLARSQKELMDNHPDGKLTKGQFYWTGFGVPEAQAMYAIFILQKRIPQTPIIPPEKQTEEYAVELLYQAAAMENPLAYLNLGIYKRAKTSSTEDAHEAPKLDMPLEVPDTLRQMTDQQCIEKSASLGCARAKYLMYEWFGNDAAHLDAAAALGDIRALETKYKVKAAPSEAERK